MAHQVIAIHAREDAASFTELNRGLASSKAQGLLVLRSVWDFSSDAELVAALDGADMLLVFLTRALVGSSLWTGTALQEAKAAQERHRIPVVPLYIEACDWQQSWLAAFAGLPRGQTPVTRARSQDEAWIAITSGLQSALKARQPRPKNVAPPAPSEPRAEPPPVQIRGADVRLAYRRLQTYHEALLRLVDVAQRALADVVGPVQSSSWEPSALLRPGRAVRSSARAPIDHIPLKQVSYAWATSQSPSMGGCRLVVVHDGDSGSGPPETSRSVLSAFVTGVVRPPLPGGDATWERTEDWIAAAHGFSPGHWEDGEAHLTEPGPAVLRFGGFSRDTESLLGGRSEELWTSPLRALLSKISVQPAVGKA